MLKAMTVMKLLAASAILAVGYLLLDRYAPHAAERMSNGYHPLGLLGSILELAAALWFVTMAARPYRNWHQRLGPRSRALLLAACIAADAALGWWTISAYGRYQAQLPPHGASFWRFSFTPLPLWACIASVLVTLRTLRPARR